MDRQTDRQTERHETDALRFPPRIRLASVITRVLVYRVGQKSKLLYCDRYRACFADINVSHGSVATYARCGGIFNIHLTANLLRNLPENFCFKSVKI